MMKVRCVGHWSGCLIENGSNVRRDMFRCSFDRIGSQVCVSRRGSYLRVAKELAEHVKALADSYGGRGEGMAQIVDADIVGSQRGSAW